MNPIRLSRRDVLKSTGVGFGYLAFAGLSTWAADNGQPMRGARFGGKLLGSPWKFNQSGKSGLWISELFPELSKYADELCLLRGMHTDVPAHSQAFLQLHTGIFQFKRPSMGAWT